MAQVKGTGTGKPSGTKDGGDKPIIKGVADKGQSSAEKQLEQNRIDAANKNYDSGSNDPAPEQFSDFSEAGIDTSSMLADIQAKYGGLAGETGRRGAQAREILSQEGDAAARDFLGTDAYQQLQEDPTRISDPAISAALTAAIGDEWIGLASGSKGDQGTINATDINFEELDALIRMKGTPFSFLSDIHSATALASNATGTDTVAEAAMTVNDNVQTPPNLPGLTVNGDPSFASERKRV